MIPPAESARRHPRITVGLPVYNGERFVAGAINAILCQTYRDFDLLISDDGSTDGTERICREAAARDARITYKRHAVNRGLAWNWDYLIECANGEFLRWTAQDDLIAPTFLEQAVKVLDADASIVLCCSQAAFIDETGAPLPRNDRTLSRVADPRPEIRFRDLVLTDHWCLPIFGLIRLKALRETRGYGSFVASDRVLLAELGLLGRFHQLEAPLFLFRRHAGQSIAVPFHRRAPIIAGAGGQRRHLPHFRFYREYFPAVSRTPLRPAEKRHCYRTLLRWWFANWNWARVLSDVIIAAFPGLARTINRVWLLTVGKHSPLKQPLSTGTRQRKERSTGSGHDRTLGSPRIR